MERNRKQVGPPTPHRCVEGLISSTSSGPPYTPPTVMVDRQRRACCVLNICSAQWHRHTSVPKVRRAVWGRSFGSTFRRHTPSGQRSVARGDRKRGIHLLERFPSTLLRRCFREPSTDQPTAWLHQGRARGLVEERPFLCGLSHGAAACLHRRWSR